MNRWELRRRDLLKRLGIGAACLPLLGTGRARAAAPGGKRLICVMQTGGYRQVAWKPPVGPLAAALPTSSSPLEPFKDHLIFLPDLANLGVVGHGYGTMFYGASVRPVAGTGQYREPAGPTLDQVVGQAFRTQSRISLNLGVQIDRPPRAAVAPGASRCFWTGARQPIIPLDDPYLAFTSIFMGAPAPATDPQAAVRRLTEKKMILDYVGGSLNQWKEMLGTEDRLVADAHLQALRDLETGLTSTSYGGCLGGSSIPMVDVTSAASYGRILDLHMQLAVMALGCGVTSVATLQLTDAMARNVDLGFRGVSPSATAGLPTWRSVSRGLFGPMAREVLDKFCMDRFAALLRMLQATPDAAGGTLLDSTIVLWANPMDDGQTHNYQRVPWILAGKAGGFFKTGQCLDGTGKPTAGVLAEICNAMNVTTHPFGPAIDGLRA